MVPTSTIIPDIDPLTIENNGERLFYQAAQELPDTYTVFYSFKYKSHEKDKPDDLVREADFVIVHPGLGFMVVEVKQGHIMYQAGQWQEFKDTRWHPLHKDPIEQARNAMFAILSLYKEKSRSNHFPLAIRYGAAFPECARVDGITPADLDVDSIFLFDDLADLEVKVLKAFGNKSEKQDKDAVNLLIDKILSPTFKIFSRLEDQIEMFHKTSERLLTEEQERILEETELDRRKIFFGSAGTGKTYLAMEKARRLQSQGAKVFLTCFNKNLARYFTESVASSITAINFHDYLLQVMQEGDPAFVIPEEQSELKEFYENTLPTCGFDHFMNLPQSRKFDAIIVDEGQDFKADWYACLDSMLVDDGMFYIFADPNQALYQDEIENLKTLPVSKHRLTRNLRNTEVINTWLGRLLGTEPARSQLSGGMPISFFAWESPDEERRLIEKEVGRLVSQGIAPKRIFILSPNVKEKSCLAGMNRVKEWPLVSIDDPPGSGICFSTIRSFKGLEADIVLLTGVREGSQACTISDIYVGASRARFLLYVFYQKGMKLPG